jgi:hypothetical protein
MISWPSYRRRGVISERLQQKVEILRQFFWRGGGKGKAALDGLTCQAVERGRGGEGSEWTGPMNGGQGKNGPAAAACGLPVSYPASAAGCRGTCPALKLVGDWGTRE